MRSCPQLTSPRSQAGLGAKHGASSHVTPQFISIPRAPVCTPPRSQKGTPGLPAPGLRVLKPLSTAAAASVKAGVWAQDHQTLRLSPATAQVDGIVTEAPAGLLAHGGCRTGGICQNPENLGSGLAVSKGKEVGVLPALGWTVLQASRKCVSSCPNTSGLVWVTVMTVTWPEPRLPAKLCSKHFPSTNSQPSRKQNYRGPHFTGEEAEAQRGVSCPRSRSEEGAESRFKSRLHT